jgi:ketosteroid isomerase-like protein
MIAQFCDPEVEWIEAPWRVDGQLRRGHAGVRESFERWLDGFEEYGFEFEQIVDCGDDVLVVAREYAQGTRSGAAISMHTYAVLSIRDGKLLRYREFNDERAARQAAGLSD